MAEGEMETEEVSPDPEASHLKWNDATRPGAYRPASMVGEQGQDAIMMEGVQKTGTVEPCSSATRFVFQSAIRPSANQVLVAKDEQLMEATQVEGKLATEATFLCSGATQLEAHTLLRSGVEKLDSKDETMVYVMIGDESYGMGGEAVNIRQITREQPQTTNLGNLLPHKEH